MLLLHVEWGLSAECCIFLVTSRAEMDPYRSRTSHHKNIIVGMPKGTEYSSWDEQGSRFDRELAKVLVSEAAPFQEDDQPLLAVRKN